jgi:excisionase family DNA binding protein
MVLSLPEAARRLGVNESRVRQRIAAGSLRAEKVGGRWLLDEADLADAGERPVGRPLSARSAWALVAVAQALADQDHAAGRGDDLMADVAPVVRSRSRARLRNYCDRVVRSLAADNEAGVAQGARELRHLLRNRAKRALYSASRVDLDDLRADDRLALSGLSRPEAGIASGGVVEGYVRRHDLGPLVEDYLLVEAAKESDANVFLHVVDEDQPERRVSLHEAIQNWLVLAADLAEHRRPREEARALELVRERAEQAAK